MHIFQIVVRSFVLATLVSTPAISNEQSILVIDGSGSMWGRIQGTEKSKIEFMREQVNRVFNDLDSKSEVGIIAFGHSEKGNCDDIEELLPVGPFDGQKISEVINSINPKGKTPLSAAVKKAANALRYTEERATVVVLGDGKENCGENPCDVAKRLETTGVDLTVHTIAFDIADDEGIEQLQCLARETGGKFHRVETPEELAVAFQQVQTVVTPDAEIAPIKQESAASTGVRLVLSGAGDKDIEWTLINLANEETTVFKAKSGSARQIETGSYDVIALLDDQFAEGTFEVSESTSSLELAFSGASAAALSVNVESSAAGGIVEASWSISAKAGDLVFIAPSTQDKNRYPLDDRSRHEVSSGSVAKLVAPSRPGNYEIRYFRPQSGTLYTQAFNVTPSITTLSGPATVMAGEKALVKVKGPAAPGDFIFIARPDWDRNTYDLDSSNRARAVVDGNVSVQAPSTPGRYEIRYFSWSNGDILATTPIKVTTANVALSTLDKVKAGAKMSINFSGPRKPGDMLFILNANESDDKYLLGNKPFEAISSGSPARLVAPAAPGTYEARYFNRDFGGLIAKAKFTVESANISIEAPRAVQRGERVSMKIKGPGAPGDIVFIAPSSWQGNTYPNNQAHVIQMRSSDEQSGSLIAPSDTGSYQIRYMSWENGVVLGSRALIVR